MKTPPTKIEHHWQSAGPKNNGGKDPPRPHIQEYSAPLGTNFDKPHLQKELRGVPTPKADFKKLHRQFHANNQAMQRIFVTRVVK